MRKVFATAAAATVLFSSAALAAVTFDAGTGTGFVGKGDVQLALGYNNKQMQDNAGRLTFTYDDSATYEVFCSKYHEETRNKEAWTDYKTFDRSQGISGTIAYDPRQRNQITGFNLTGYAGDPVLSGDPTVCPGGFDADYDGAAQAGATDGSNVVLIESAGGGLKVNGVAL